MTPTEHSSMRLRGAYLLLGAVALLMVSDFLLRGVVLAFEPSRTDFSELYTSAWLWRHGQNFYNSTLATDTQQRLVGVSVQAAPIYPPTAFVLVSPFTFLPWRWADFLWLLLGLAAVAATIFLLLRIRGDRAWNLRTMIFITFLLSFTPLHQAFHLGNVTQRVRLKLDCARPFCERRHRLDSDSPAQQLPHSCSFSHLIGLRCVGPSQRSTGRGRASRL